jgi:hypothetical protein
MLDKIREPTLDSVHVIVRERFGLVYKQRKSKEDISGLTDIGVHRRRQDRREKLAKQLSRSEGYFNFTQWMFGIQSHFGWTDDEFGRQLGYANRRMIQCFRRSEGSLPSKKVLMRLFELEKLSLIRVREEI